AWPWACIYREYLTDDARLVMANVRAGIEAGGVAVNYLRAEGVVKDHARVTGVRAKDIGGREVLVKGRAVINAAGPWVESICQQDGLATPKPMVLSKGIHIVVTRDRLPIHHPVMMVSQDNRPVFAIPRGDIVYIGTTDSLYCGPADHWPRVEQEEVKYLFEPVQRYFGVQLRFADVRMTWAGLRPLIRERGKSTRDISRKDEVWVSKSGLITIAGGKLTGYRKMAEDAVTRAVEEAGLMAREPADDVPLPGGDSFVDLDGRDLSDVRLIRLYGSERDQVLACGGMPLIENGMIRSGEIIWAIRREGAMSLEDVLYRRTRAALYRPDEALVVVEPASRLMAAELGWPEATRLDQIRRVRNRLLTDPEFAKARG
ncbi:MAG: glycerol-3-phosphate dehydrogenase/oxidase, partial [Pseudomonadales bacterium]|nr:glycerol-3-phosphate dehydrogenase/oxidase [Pseudomonadales bacterium]